MAVPDRHLLLVRRGGCLWGLPNNQVRSVSGGGSGPAPLRVELESATVWADEILRLERNVSVRPMARSIQWAVPPGCAGFALCDLGPVVVVDGQRPPSMLVHHDDGVQSEEDDDAG